MQDINSLADKLIRQGRTDTKAIKLKQDVLNDRYALQYGLPSEYAYLYMTLSVWLLDLCSSFMLALLFASSSSLSDPLCAFYKLLFFLFPFERLLKQCIDDLIVPITAINLSMREGVVPPDFKQAIVTPLIKKKTLCRNEFKNYRPISNLSFLSKILEKIVAKRLNAHIEEHLLSNHVQSAYKRFHSTETALLKIHNNIICNMDNGKVTALTLLDLSAAFVTIDHSTLLERLHVHFGISGTVFQWFKSYISNRQQRVYIDGSLSCPQDLRFGVPQGSVLGPFLFCLYTTSISQMINTHDVSHHMYADDTQVYIELSQSDTYKSISSLSDCLTDISLWMKSSKLKLNSNQSINQSILLRINYIHTSHREKKPSYLERVHIQ